MSRNICLALIISVVLFLDRHLRLAALINFSTGLPNGQMGAGPASCKSRPHRDTGRG